MINSNSEDVYVPLPQEQRQFLIEALKTQLNQYTFTNQQQSANHEMIGAGTTAYRAPVFYVEDMEQSYIDLNQSFLYIGDNSIFQKRITWILSMQWISFTFIVMGMTYIFRSPKFKCIGSNGVEMACSQEAACMHSVLGDMDVRVVYPTQYSITEEFSLICGREHLEAYAQSLLFLGGFLSGYIFNYFSNKIGRRYVALSLLMHCQSTHHCLAIRFRTISINILTMVWAGAPILFPLMNLLPSWRALFVAFSIPLGISLIFMYKCFLESPRFLVSKRCFKQAREIFKQISITNKRPPYQFHLLEQLDHANTQVVRLGNTVPKEHREASPTEKKKKRKTAYNYFDLFAYPSLRKPTLILMIMWLVRFFMYYGLSLALESISNTGLFLTAVISASAFAEVLGSFGIPIMTTYLFHTKKLNIIRTSLLVVTILCLLLWFITIPNSCKHTNKCTQIIYSVVLILLIKFFLTIISTGLITYGPQVYSTGVRSLGHGFTLTFGRLGTVIVPFYINYMKVNYFGKNPLCYLAPFTFLCFLLSYLLPYTEDIGMMDAVEEDQRNIEMVTRNRNIVPSTSTSTLLLSPHK